VRGDPDAHAAVEATVKMGLEAVPHNFLTGRLEDLVKWARRNSVWPAPSAWRACAMEMMASGAAHYDTARFGMEVFRASPRRPTS
jgi:NADH-quinone oxidoreductase subunit B